jgi:hypothetical protein
MSALPFGIALTCATLEPYRGGRTVCPPRLRHVSTDDQNLALQRDALAAAGCEKIYEDKTSGAKAERPGLGLALEVARAGDTLIVWRLDRLGRSLKDLIALAEGLDKRGVGLKSLKEALDTTSRHHLQVFPDYRAIVDTCCAAWNQLVAEPGRIRSLCDQPWIRNVGS